MPALRTAMLPELHRQTALATPRLAPAADKQATLGSAACNLAAWTLPYAVQNMMTPARLEY